MSCAKLRNLNRRSMKNAWLGLFLFCFVEVHAQVIETFDDNRNDWTVKGNDACSRKIENGKYFLTTFNEGHGQFTNLPAFFGAHKDFVLEASFTQRSGSIDNGIGLYWGRSGDLYNEFLFTTNGY